MTVQSYQATSNGGVVSEEDMAEIAGQIGRVYQQADYVGSLVVEEETGRPTEYAGPQRERHSINYLLPAADEGMIGRMAVRRPARANRENVFFKGAVMSDNMKPSCPECAESFEAPEVVDRRNFIRVLGGGAAALATLGGAGSAGRVLATEDTQPKKITRPAKPAEDLVRQLYASLSAEQKKEVILPWDHGSEGGKRTPTRLRMFNTPIGKKHIADVYTPAQQELIEQTLRAICSDEEGYRRISRNGKFDSSGSLGGCGVTLFGDPSDGGKFAWVFSGHHLTVRCDGNSEEGAAFGGPMYYGHSPNGYSAKNVFFYQTKSVLSVYEALSGEQRKKAVVTGTPGEGEPSIRFKKKIEEQPGILYKDLTADQKQLIEKVMRDVLSPYRKEDVEEVMEIVKANGGMEKIHLAFYPDKRMKDDEPWHFWRLEGPGFVWNYRVLPHVHTYVNISSKM